MFLIRTRAKSAWGMVFRALALLACAASVQAASPETRVSRQSIQNYAIPAVVLTGADGVSRPLVKVLGDGRPAS